MSRSTRLSILFAILLVALAVRLVGLQFGLPFAYARPDIATQVKFRKQAKYESHQRHRGKPYRPDEQK